MDLNRYNILYNLIFSPKRAFRNIITEKPWYMVFVIFLFVRISKTISKGVVWSGSPFWGKAIFSFGVSGEILVVLMFWIILTCVFHLFAQLFGGKGEGKLLFLSLGFTSFPLIFLVPLSLIAASWEKGGWLLWVIFSIILYIWSFILKIVAIKEVYEIDQYKALAVIILPFLVLSGLLIFVPILSIIQFMIINNIG